VASVRIFGGKIKEWFGSATQRLEEQLGE
jgi:hypothetical protein